LKLLSTDLSFLYSQFTSQRAVSLSPQPILAKPLMSLRSAITLAPTVKQAASGVPLARGLNLAASAGASAHGHGHGDSATRTDFAGIPKWASRTDVGASGLISRSKINGQSSEPRVFGRARERAFFDWLGWVREERA
jgi:hypothetical protein